MTGMISAETIEAQRDISWSAKVFLTSLLSPETFKSHNGNTHKYHSSREKRKKQSPVEASNSFSSVQKNEEKKQEYNKSLIE